MVFVVKASRWTPFFCGADWVALEENLFSLWPTNGERDHDNGLLLRLNRVQTQHKKYVCQYSVISCTVIIPCANYSLLINGFRIWFSFSDNFGIQLIDILLIDLLIWSCNHLALGGVPSHCTAADPVYIIYTTLPLLLLLGYLFVRYT